MKEVINETGMTMDQVESLLSSILKNNGISLRATDPQDTPNVPKPEDVDTGDRTRLLKGIKQVTFEEYEALTEEDRKQYVFFVREESGATFGFVGIGNLKYTMVPEDIRGIDCGFFPVCSGDTPDTGETPDTGSTTGDTPDTGSTTGDTPDSSPINGYLTFTITEPGALGWYGNNTAVYYSLDSGGTWLEMSYLPVNETPAKIIVKSNGYGHDGTLGHFMCIGDGIKFNVSGNIMSMLYGDNFNDQVDLGTTDIFNGLFSGCTGLVDASGLILPSTSLTDGCYAFMFKDCTNLKSAPELPAITLANNCYNRMFAECSELETNEPLLINAQYFYYEGCCTTMFRDTKVSKITFPNGISPISGDALMDFLSGVTTNGVLKVNNVNEWAEYFNNMPGSLPSTWVIESIS